MLSTFLPLRPGRERTARAPRLQYFVNCARRARSLVLRRHAVLALLALSESAQAENRFVFEYEPDDRAVLSTGEPGSWDSAYVYAPYVVRDAKEGRYLLFYAGISSDQRWNLGLASSDDGRSWRRLTRDRPLLPSVERASMPVVTPPDDDRLRWRLYFVDSFTERRDVRLRSASAERPEGPWTVDPPLRWTPEDLQPVPRDVVRSEDRWVMLFNRGHDPSRANTLHVATSPDGSRWTLDPDPVLQVTRSSWASEATIASNLLALSDGTHATLVMGQDSDPATSSPIGWASSSDRLAWILENEGQPVIATRDEPYYSFLHAFRVGDSLHILLPWEAGRRGIRQMVGPWPWTSGGTP